jgi:hypothetical protein
MDYWLVEIVDDQGCWLEDPTSFDTEKEAKDFALSLEQNRPELRINLCRVSVEEYYGANEE